MVLHSMYDTKAEEGTMKKNKLLKRTSLDPKF